MTENTDRIFSFLKSVYRYTKLLEMEAPEILMKLEDDILIDRLTNLCPEDIVCAVLLWEEFSKQKLIDDAKLDAQLDLDFNTTPPN